MVSDLLFYKKKIFKGWFHLYTLIKCNTKIHNDAIIIVINEEYNYKLNRKLYIC